jgi:hypothetical protein
MNELAQIGPAQVMSVGFEPGANFEGRIADELARLESQGIIRVLELLFVARDTDSDELVVLEHQEESMGAVVGALLGMQLDETDEGSGHSFGMSAGEIEEMGAALPHGGSAGLLLIEHVWARELKRAIRDAGGIRSETSSSRPRPWPPWSRSWRPCPSRSVGARADLRAA